jgi:hypothetical protein
VNVRHLNEATVGASSPYRSGAAHVLVRPGLWWPGLVIALRFAPRGWWRRAPFTPVPDARYWQFRMETAYGDEDANVPGDELADVLRWARRAGPRRR